MGKVYYDEYGNRIYLEKGNGCRNVALIILAIIVFGFGVVGYQLFDTAVRVNQLPVFVDQTLTTLEAIDAGNYEQVPTVTYEPSFMQPDIKATAEFELTRTAPTPTTNPTIVPTGSYVETESDVIIITDGNGYPVYAGPLTQDQWQQCQDIAASGNFWRLVDYQKPICMAALGN